MSASDPLARLVARRQQLRIEAASQRQRLADDAHTLARSIAPAAWRARGRRLLEREALALLAGGAPPIPPGRRWRRLVRWASLALAAWRAWRQEARAEAQSSTDSR